MTRGPLADAPQVETDKAAIDKAETDQAEDVFTAHPEHAEAVDRALHAIQQLLIDQPEFGEVLRTASSTDEVRVALLEHGIEISNGALWRHRGMLTKEGQPSWRG